MSWIPRAGDWEGPVWFPQDPDPPPPEYYKDCVPGVYVLASTDKSKCHSRHKHTTDYTSAAYVGQTDELISHRIKSHMSYRDPNPDLYDFLNEIKYTKLRYWFLKEDNGENRDDFEHSLFWYYGGSGKLLNISVPPGHRVPIEPPF